MVYKISSFSVSLRFLQSARILTEPLSDARYYVRHFHIYFCAEPTQQSQESAFDSLLTQRINKQLLQSLKDSKQLNRDLNPVLPTSEPIT